MEIRTFLERVSVVKQESPDKPVEHLGWITTKRTLRVLDSGRLRETLPKTPDRVLSVEIDGQTIPLDVDYSPALFLEFFPGFTGFGKDSFSEVEEYLERNVLKRRKKQHEKL